MENKNVNSSYWEFYLNTTTCNNLVYIEVYHEERYVDTIFGSDIDEVISKLEKFMHSRIVHTFLAMRHYDITNFVSSIKAY